MFIIFVNESSRVELRCKNSLVQSPMGPHDCERFEICTVTKILIKWLCSKKGKCFLNTLLFPYMQVVFCSGLLGQEKARKANEH